MIGIGPNTTGDLLEAALHQYSGCDTRDCSGLNRKAHRFVLILMLLEEIWK
jgi:hypothetical protein